MLPICMKGHLHEARWRVSYRTMYAFLWTTLLRICIVWLHGCSTPLHSMLMGRTGWGMRRTICSRWRPRWSCIAPCTNPGGMTAVKLSNVHDPGDIQDMGMALRKMSWMRTRTRKWLMARARRTWWWIVHGSTRKIIRSRTPGRRVWTPQLVSYIWVFLFFFTYFLVYICLIVFASTIHIPHKLYHHEQPGQGTHSQG